MGPELQRSIQFLLKSSVATEADFMASMVPCILDSSVEYNAMLQEPKSRGREEGREEREGTVILVNTLGRPGVRACRPYA